MSMKMFSPPRHEKARNDDSHLPKGDCRFILLHPKVEGLRCACVGFALNKSIPGSTCDCGHLACYHATEKDDTSVERQEVEALKKKVDLLEAQLERERNNERERICRLEELVDKTRAEHDAEFKNMYRNVSGLWNNVGGLNRRIPYYDDHIEALVDDGHQIRNRLIEVDDASMRLEDRVDAIERLSSQDATFASRRRKASTPPSPGFDDGTDFSLDPDETVTTSRRGRFQTHLGTSDASQIQSFRERVSSVGSGSQSWTVHVSLLPTSSQPFPFEKDTAAYKRCLSRGLHQMIVIPDIDSTSFKNAIDTAFAEILRGRPWNPLVARLCDAQNLRGLPMLRQLPEYLLSCDHDMNFLQEHCSVNDESGKILDLYIAMMHDTLSWAELKNVIPYKLGLEASWDYDQLLDGPNPEEAKLDTSRPAAGDIIPAWSPSLKRKESDISRAQSFGSTSDNERNRAKIRRQCTATAVELIGRQAEAV
jgi:hypothetical protein